jgi:branched-subunit amino acid transport protein
VSTWTALLIAGGLAFVLKFLGYVVPASWLDGERTTRITSALPIALLAALVGVQTLTSSSSSGAIALDSRAAAVGVAIVALLLRAPFIVVVILGAAVAAGLRLLGLP